MPYNRYSIYLKKKYNERVQKITVLGGFTCPNRDGSLGTGGCTYCNNNAFAPPDFLKEMSITEQINHGIRISKKLYKSNKHIIYFQSYSNTYAPIEKLKELFELPIGYQDHCDAETEEAFWIPALSVGMGVSILEKHITHV